jgi:hypothetical protein
VGRFLYYGYVILKNRVALFILGALLSAAAFWLLLVLPWDFVGLQGALITRPQAVAAAGQETFSGSTLQKSVMINKAAQASGVTFQVNTVEQYSDGFSFTYTVATNGTGQVPMVLQPELVQVTDENGTVYKESLDSSGVTVGPGMSRGYVSFIPAIKGNAGKVKISVPHMLIVGAQNSDQPKVVDGPWQVEHQF